MKPKIQKIAIAGLTLNARVWGPPSGPKILALHGWLDNAASFDPLAPLLTGYHIVAVDFPGHGYSDHLPAGMTYFHEDRVVQIVRLIEVLGWEEFTIIGHSMGGVVGLLTSLVLPTRIKKIILFDVLWYLTATAEHTVNDFKKFVLSAAGPTHTHTIHKSLLEAVQIRTQVDPVISISEKSAKILARGGLQRVDGGLMWTFDTRLLNTSNKYSTEPQVKKILENITTPICIVISSEGMMQKVPGLKDRIAHLKNKVVIELPGSHYIHMESPELVAQAILPFLKA